MVVWLMVAWLDCRMHACISRCHEWIVECLYNLYDLQKAFATEDNLGSVLTRFVNDMILNRADLSDLVRMMMLAILCI